MDHLEEIRERLNTAKDFYVVLQDTATQDSPATTRVFLAVIKNLTQDIETLLAQIQPAYFFNCWNDDEEGPLQENLVGPFETVAQAQEKGTPGCADNAAVYQIRESKFQAVSRAFYNPEEDLMVWTDVVEENNGS